MPCEALRERRERRHWGVGQDCQELWPFSSFPRSHHASLVGIHAGRTPGLGAGAPAVDQGAHLLPLLRELVGPNGSGWLGGGGWGQGLRSRPHRAGRDREDQVAEHEQPWQLRPPLRHCGALGEAGLGWLDSARGGRRSGVLPGRLGGAELRYQAGYLLLHDRRCPTSRWLPLGLRADDAGHADMAARPVAPSGHHLGCEDQAQGHLCGWQGRFRWAGEDPFRAGVQPSHRDSRQCVGHGDLRRVGHLGPGTDSGGDRPGLRPARGTRAAGEVAPEAAAARCMPAGLHHSRVGSASGGHPRTGDAIRGQDHRAQPSQQAIRGQAAGGSGRYPGPGSGELSSSCGFRARAGRRAVAGLCAAERPRRLQGGGDGSWCRSGMGAGCD